MPSAHQALGGKYLVSSTQEHVKHTKTRQAKMLDGCLANVRQILLFGRSPSMLGISGVLELIKDGQKIRNIEMGGKSEKSEWAEKIRESEWAENWNGWNNQNGRN